MANTTNIDLVKPAGTDHALVSVLNANSDKIDAEAGNVRSNFALVQNTNTATQAISKDQLVVWKGVLKKATSNIANGATLSNSNLSDTKVSTELAALSDQMSNIDNALTSKANIKKQSANGATSATISGLKTAHASYLVTVHMSNVGTALYLININSLGELAFKIDIADNSRISGITYNNGTLTVTLSSSVSVWGISAILVYSNS